MKKGNRKNAIVARPGKKETGSKKTSFQSSFPHASMPNNAPRFFTTQRINWGKMSITGKWHLNGQKEAAKFHSDMKVALYGNLMCHAKFEKPHWVSSL